MTELHLEVPPAIGISVIADCDYTGSRRHLLYVPIENHEACIFDRLPDAVEEAERFAVMEALPDCDL